MQKEELLCFVSLLHKKVMTSLFWKEVNDWFDFAAQ